MMELIFSQSASEMSFIYRWDECQKVRVTSPKKKEEKVNFRLNSLNSFEDMYAWCVRKYLYLCLLKREGNASSTREGNLYNIKDSSLKKMLVT